MLVQIIKAHNAKRQASALARKTAGAKWKRCTDIAYVVVEGAAGEDTCAAEIPAHSPNSKVLGTEVV